MNWLDAVEIWARVESHYDTGYYREQPWYKPALAGYRETTIPITDEEWDAAGKMGQIQAVLQERDVVSADAVRIFMGAFAGGRELSKNQRYNLFYRTHGMQKRDYYRKKDSGMRFIEGGWTLTNR